MKRCLKHPEPPTLTTYRLAKPNATWVEMRDDPLDGGQQAARDVKRVLVRGQRGLCAYCETPISDGCSDEEITAYSHHQRVEHFHSKSDSSRPPNWNLHWPNLWAVCMGGSKPNRDQQEDVLYPTSRNLSCDAHKDHQITKGRLPLACEGHVLSPEDVPASPPLFDYGSDGMIQSSANCAHVTIPANKHSSTTKLVDATIEHFNLNCFRLAERRRIISSQLEKDIAKMRSNSQGQPPHAVLLAVAQRRLHTSPNTCWSNFFTLIRVRLGNAAETHLTSIGFAG